METAATNFTAIEVIVPSAFLIVALVLMCVLIKYCIKTEG
jgi:hypothetical protein